MKLLVDSSVVIDYLRGDPEVERHFSSPDLTLHCSSVTLTEVSATRAMSAAQAQALKARLRRLLRVIDYRDPAVLRAFDQLKRHHAASRSDRADALIAATAMAKRMPLWTKNRRHFEGIEGLTLFDPAAKRT